MADTQYLDAARPGNVERAASLLAEGGLVAFATETVYGLGAHALDPEAVASIFHAKQRPSWDPLIVHIATLPELFRLVTLSTELRARVEQLAAAFWPGPLTLLLARSAAIPDAVTAGRTLVGVRMPAHPVAQALLRTAGVPIAAPSANRFGHTSPTTAQHVLDDLAGRIDAVLDAGPCAVGVESTVLDPAPTPAIIYRSGAVTPEQIASVIGVPVTLYEPEVSETSQTLTQPEALPSPGVGMRHYAPEAKLILTDGSPPALERAVLELQQQGSNPIGVMLPQDWHPDLAGSVMVEPWGRWSDPTSLAADLFKALRALEAQHVQAIVCPLPAPGGLGNALRDRLLKAARPL